jgi:probable rRNA maturation factor
VSDLEIEIVGAPTGDAADLRRLCARALKSAGITEGHLAIEVVDEDRITELNRAYRGRDEPTDVLSFGVDEAGPTSGPRELGDIFICPVHTEDIREAVVHGALHLAGMDHELDQGEMLALQEAMLRARAQ